MNLIAKAPVPHNVQPHYMVQLDALRAFAVLGVLVHHFLPQEFFLNSKFYWGPLGVRFFFVLSGFLITGILLRCKELVDSTQQDTWFTIRRFYMRRFIRLMPIYYLTIFLTIILAGSYITNSLIWHLTYTSNIYFSLNEWDILTSHFWSLSVEEQFYLFWPLVIIILPKRYLLLGIISTIFIGIVFKLLLVGLNITNGTREYILTFACFEAFGFGALLAFLNHNKKQFTRAKKYLRIFSFWIGIPLFIAFNLMSIPYLNNTIQLSLGDTTASIFFIWLIDSAARGFNGLAGVILELPCFVYLGKISYGIYVYHLLVHYTINKIVTFLGLPFPDSIWIRFILYTVATIIVAVLSWQFLEKPINALKRNFEYKKMH